MNLSSFRHAFRSLELPFSRPPPHILPRRHTQCLQQTPAYQAAPFSSTSRMQKRSKRGQNNGPDPRITNIRYHLSHGLTPRPLLFSRTRHLRHWTIHRAWMLFQRKRRWEEERELERLYMSMRAACEHLRLLDANGNRVSEEEAGGQGADPGRLGVKGKEVGRLYRNAMLKRGVWGSVPVEYGRLQTDFPSREGWNHEWTRS